MKVLDIDFNYVNAPSGNIIEVRELQNPKAFSTLVICVNAPLGKVIEVKELQVLKV